MIKMDDNPIFDEVMVELEIDPEEQLGHDERTENIVASYPSAILTEEDETDE